MSQHNKTDFKHFTKAELDEALIAHHLPANKPGQLADAFRNGAEWAAGYLKSRRSDPTTPDTELPGMWSNSDFTGGPGPVRECKTCLYSDPRGLPDCSTETRRGCGMRYHHWRPIKFIPGGTEHGPI